MRRIALVSLFCACSAPTEPGPGPDVVDCASVWGPVPVGGRIVVQANAAPGGDGSDSAPYPQLWWEGEDADGDGLDDVDSALEAARATGIRRIVVGPGVYAGSIEINDGLWGDAGLQIVGCGRAQTEIQAVVETVEVPGDDDNVEVDLLQSVVSISGPGTVGVVLRDLALVGGRRALMVVGGAGAPDPASAGPPDPVVVQRVDILDSTRLGILIDGAATAVTLTDVVVSGVAEEEGAFGWGIAIQSRATLPSEIAAPTELSGVQVEGARGVGVLVDGGWIAVTGLTVVGTEPVGGTVGRGIQLQARTWGALADVTCSGNADAGLHLHKPGRLGSAGILPVEISDSTFSGTALAELPGEPGEMAGDGLSAAQGSSPGAVEDSVVVLSGVTFSANNRAQVVADGVTVVLGEGNIFGKGGAYPLVAQGGAVVEGVGGAPIPAEYEASVQELTGTEALGVLAGALGLDSVEDP